MKLINRYNQYLFPALFILFLASAFSSYFLIKKVLQNELDEILLRSKVRIENYVADNNALPIVNSFDDEQITFEKINTALTDSGLSSATQYIPEQQKNHISRKLIFTVSVNNQKYKTVISCPLEGTKHLTKLLVKIALVTIVVLFLLLMLINRQVLSKIWEPFYQSLQVIKKFKVSHAKLPVFPITVVDEFKLMNNQFSLAAENANKDFKSLKEFSENASHEIQTPLAIIHSKIDLLAQQENLTEKQSELLQSLYASVNKLSKIQQSLSLLTKIDNSQFSQKSKIALNGEVITKVEQFLDIWQNKGIELTTQIGKTTIFCNKELLEILLNNLLGNATRHNISSGSIHIKLEDEIFEISNTGIDESLDPNRIFKRFYKVLPNSESNGLGLSIIKEICDTSGFNITYSFKENNHIFTLTWQNSNNKT
jgi:signal transduction histidine kinase